MVARPRITQDYWDEANKLELEHINQHVEPEIPERFVDDDEAMDVEAPAWTATALRRNAMPSNGIAIWWTARDDKDGPGFWTDIDGYSVDL